ncbi:galactitol-1-phosphate 5-dehydrogenase [Paenibacillus cisolokensis]|uniref:Galactitol-1-phosphate 5-dehydrogenase n=1 Tax=Paenibacillus cisolokensis TaxID=1658519 RepID=A0ABQ4N9N9_9BACL|nr:alcohol dehydrogenase catalytic domain-containing protein [Paenibacillus cisolokensis]GIQ64965.1 galactitol-1-phosphate 5-dehydrogenase [Paenibacillus cisolokensis]
MIALVYEGPRRMEIREVDVPSLGAADVLIEVAYSGICGSELSGYLGKNSLRKPPLIFGHEFSGRIAGLGEGVGDVRPELRIGDRVTANPLVTCGTCRYCAAGAEQLCTDRKLLSASLPGSNAKYVAVPARFVYRLPDSVPLEQAALTEPIACAARAADLGRVTPDTDALIVGMGPIGIFTLQALQIHGARRILVADTNAERLAFARAMGAETINPLETDTVEAVKLLTDGAGVGLAIDAVGAATTRNACVHSAAAGGTVVFVGLHEADSQLPVNHIVRNEIHCVGSFAYASSHFETALQWVAEGRAGLSAGLVKAPLRDGPAWYERLLGQPGAVAKVLLTLSEEEL